jgi:hypothetical protein
MPAAGDRRADLDRLHRRLFWLHGVRAVTDGVARRRFGFDRSRLDHRDLGQRAGDAIGSGLATRFGGLRVFVFGTSALVIGITGAALLEYPVTWAVTIGIFGSFHPGVIMAVGTLSARPENRAIGMGLFYSVYYAGGAVVPTLCGWAADMAGGLEGALLTAAATSALAAPMYLLHRRLSGRAIASM